MCNTFLENVFINIQNLIYGISIALEVNELHTFEVRNLIAYQWLMQLSISGHGSWS